MLKQHGSYVATDILMGMGFDEEAKKLKEEAKNKEQNRRFEYDYRINENGKTERREEFIFHNLNNAIGKKPDLIGTYPGLSLLYRENGKVKSFEDLISGDYKLNESDKSEALEDFCKYYISRGELQKLDLSKFPEKVQANIASRLISILMSEKSQLGKMNKEHNTKGWHKEIDKKYKKRVEFFHLRNSHKIMQFINNNYEHFRELQDNEKFSSLINMDSYTGNAVLPFRKDEFYENLAYIDEYPIAQVDLQREANIAKEKEKEYKSKKKQKFTEHNLESSFDALTNDTRISQFNGATQEMRNLEGIQKVQEEKEMEEK